MKINKKTFPLRIYTILLLLIDLHCMYVVKYSSFLEQYLGSSNRLWVLGFFGILLYLIYYGKSWEKEKIGKYQYLHGLVFSTITATIILIISSSFRFSLQSIYDTLRLSGQYLWYAQAFIYVFLFTYDGSEKRVMNMLNNIITIWYIILVLQYFAFQFGGRLIFDFSSYFSSDVMTREEGIRLSMKSLGIFMIIDNYYTLYTSSVKKVFPTIIVAGKLCLGLFCLIFIQQTRAYFLVVGVSVIVITLLANKTVSNKLRAFIILFVVAIYFVSTGTISDYIHSFSLDAQYGGSTLARLGAVEYYWSKFTENPFLGGVGLAASQYYNTLVHGPTGLSYLDDVGIFGLLATTGLLSIILYFMPLIRILKNAIRLFRFDRQEGAYGFAIFTYLLLSSVSLLVVNQQRMYLFPILIAVMEFKVNKVGNLND